MLTIVVGDEGFNEDTKEFVLMNPVSLSFEHSLVSLSKWESEFNKPFLTTQGHTVEEVLGYIRSMLLTPDVTSETIDKLTPADYQKLQEYINSPQSATTFGRMPKGHGPSEIITSELIYYWMVAFTIPFECETWHLSRLFNLIRICNIKNSKPEPQNTREAAMERDRINKERRARLGTRG